MEACTEKRRRYQEEIANIPSEKLVYIDESGIELTICKDRGLRWPNLSRLKIRNCEIQFAL